MEKQYYKVWFTDGKQSTAKLVVDTEKFPDNTSIENYSRLFPIQESTKMKRFCRTSLYNSFDEAFNERSNAQDLLKWDK